MNILLSFAQFEREVIGERVRDKIAASKQKGMWMGGVAPLGYATQDRKLVVVSEEAATVRRIFDILPPGAFGDRKLIVVKVQLFANLGLPVRYVVAGERPNWRDDEPHSISQSD